MDEIKQKFMRNLERNEKMITKLKKENFYGRHKSIQQEKMTGGVESTALVFAYKKTQEQLNRHLAEVVINCKKRMVRDVIVKVMDLQKIE